jgi:hypothetical protein
METVKGSCLCGSIKYSCSSEQVFVLACHCNACQKATGSAFALVVGFKKEDFTVSGDTITTYNHTGDSGNVSIRRFCSKCGSGVYAENPLRPGIVTVRGGTLDMPFQLKPAANVYWRDHQEWVEHIADMPLHDTKLRK